MTGWRRGGKTIDTTEAGARWRLTRQLNRYGLTQEDFDRLLEARGYACAMCGLISRTVSPSSSTTTCLLPGPAPIWTQHG